LISNQPILSISQYLSLQKFVFNNAIISELARFEHLTELKVERVHFYPPDFVQVLVHRLSTIRKLSFTKVEFEEFNFYNETVAADFCMNLSQLFPNLDELNFVLFAKTPSFISREIYLKLKPQFVRFFPNTLVSLDCLP